MRQLTTLFVNGNILTMDRSVPRVEALLVREGRIAAMGPSAGVAASAPSNARRIDLQGRTVVPGFIDCHCHILGFGLTLDQIDVSPDAVRTIDDIKRLVGQRARAASQGSWVIGRGYDQNILFEGRDPTRTDLDEATEDVPVVLWHTSGHALTCNSRALALAGITSSTDTPPDGDIERDAHGEPTGVMKEAAVDLLSRVIPPPTTEQGAEAVVRAMEVMASQGITSASDAATGDGDSIEPQLAIYRSALASGRLTGRVTLMPQIRYVAPPGERGARTAEDFDTGSTPDWLTIGPTKIFADGALTTRTAAVRSPYIDQGGFGILMWDSDVLSDVVRRAHSAGWQIATHAIGDRAVAEALNAYAAALSEDPREDHRHRIEHCMMVDRDLALRMQQLGVVAVAQPGFIGRLGDAYVQALGMERASNLMPLETFDFMGVSYAFSSDRPVIPGAPLKGIRSAMQRITPSGTVLGRQHCVSPLEAIRHYTAGGAYATRTEDRMGALRRDALADFAVLSHNPADMEPEEFARVRVEMTVVGGIETFGE